MSNIKSEFHYSVVTTADGSPTLRFEAGEHMHSLDGAYSETDLIYGRPIMFGLQHDKPALLSLGLGLGYVEILAACKILETELPPCPLHSYEADPWLREQFLRWLYGENSALADIYDEILELTAADYDFEMVDAKLLLMNMKNQGLFQIYGPLTSASVNPLKFTGVAFDAFSSRTSPELWTPEFLDGFLGKFAAEKCMLSTYAATGNLTRTLDKHGFHVEKIPGFGRKREATMAIRER